MINIAVPLPAYPVPRTLVAPGGPSIEEGPYLIVAFLRLLRCCSGTSILTYLAPGRQHQPDRLLGRTKANRQTD